MGFLGDSGPKAPIVLGTNSLSLSEHKVDVVKTELWGLTLLAQLYHVVESLDVDPEHICI